MLDDYRRTGALPTRLRRVGLVAFVTLCTVPVLLTHPGRVEADTKSYLYLDPARFLAGAGSMWDPKIGLGTSSHQTIGYLFPLGPWYWLTVHVMGMPAWIAQRLWLAGLLVAAGLGLRYLLRVFGVDGPGVPVAMLAYAFTPYVLEYSARLSVLLAPWAALPWMLGFVVLALRNGGWRYPALFALTVQLVSSVNATAFIYAMIGPALWIPYAVWVTRDATLRRAWAVVWRIGLLSTVTSLWWASGLWVEGKYGLNILRFTESIKSVSATAFPYEILRGLGYWFFYGRDRSGLWNEAFLTYSLNVGVIFVSFAIPAFAMFSGTLVRWRHRAFFAVLTVVGIAIAVGASPYDDPSLVGRVFKSFATTSTAGFALRSTARATPLVAMSLAVLLGVGISALARHLRSRERPLVGVLAATVAGACCLANAAGLWGGAYYSRYLERGEQLPKYWTDALADLDRGSHSTRVLALPGADFAAYRWGDTIDPIEPGLMDRPYVARELVPWGSEPGANLLQAVDRRVQENQFEPSSLAAMARLMAVGDVVLRFDLQTDRFSLVPAGTMWKQFTEQPADGTGPLRRYGDTIPGTLQFPAIPDVARPASEEPDPSPVATISIRDALDIVRAKPESAPLVVSADGEGLVDLAAAGLLDARRVVVYSATTDHAALLRALPDDAVLAITDTNRRRGQRWAGLVNDYGYTEQAGETPLVADPLDQRLVLFPDAPDATRTVTELHGLRSLRATTYGTPAFGYNAGARPASAFDGSVQTSWIADDGVPWQHERLELETERPVATDHIVFVQPKAPDNRPLRLITRISMRFDGGAPVVRTLDASSRAATGQRVDFPHRTFRRLSIRVEAVRERSGLAIITKSGIGFSEIRIQDDAAAAPIRVTETTRLPEDLLHTTGAASATHPLAVVMTRDSTMDGLALRRRFTIPTDRDFSVSGTVQLSSDAKDDALDRAFGTPGAADGGVTATSSGRLIDPLARASSAIDGDESTAWNTPTNRPRKTRLVVRTADDISFDHMDLVVVTDGRHSVPTTLTLRTDGGDTRTIALPASTPNASQSGLTRVHATFPAVHGRQVTVTVSEVRPVVLGETALPVALAELGIPGVRRAPLPTNLPSTCNPGLLSIDGKPFAVRVVGTSDAATRQHQMRFEPCDETTVHLRAGSHTIESHMNPQAGANRTGFDLTRVALVSGGDGRGANASAFTLPTGSRAPTLTTTSSTRSSETLRVDGATRPYWLVLGQNVNAGWHARIDGRDLGPAKLVDGFANGWLVTPRTDGTPSVVELEWTPQRVVAFALGASAIGLVTCVGILIGAAVSRRRQSRSGGTHDTAATALGTTGGSGGTSVATLAPRRATTRLARRPLAAAIVALSFGVTSALLVRPWVGPVLTLLAWWAVVDPRGRTVVRWLPGVTVTGVAVYISAAQLLEKYPPRFDWPTFFDSARIPTWIALFVFALDAVIGTVWSDDEETPDGDV